MSGILLNILLRNAAPVHLTAISAFAAVIVCKQLLMQPQKLAVNLFLFSVFLQVTAKPEILVFFFPGRFLDLIRMYHAVPPSLLQIILE